MQEPICPHCTAPMAEGFLLELARNVMVQDRWCPGAPQRTKWLGLRRRHWKEAIPISTYRCPGCSYLQLYAFATPPLSPQP